MMVKKIVLFKENLQTIEKLIAQGYTHKEIHLKLLNEHGLHIAYKTYDKYYYQLRHSVNATETTNEPESSDVINNLEKSQNVFSEKFIYESKNSISEDKKCNYEKPKSTLTKLNEKTEKLLAELGEKKILKLDSL